MLLTVISFAWLLYQNARQRFKNLLHLETQHRLVIHEQTNTRLQQANVTLQESEEKLSVTLTSLGDAVIATDAAGRMTLLNPVAEELTGWSQAEAVGRPVDEVFIIINQHTRQPATIPVLAALEHGTTQGLANHTVLVARDGRERAISDSCAPIRDRAGRVVGAVLVFRDVTGEYAAQQNLLDSTARIQTVLKTVADGIITLHADSGIVETANPAAEQMFGYGAAQLIGQHLSTLIPGGDQVLNPEIPEWYGAGADDRTLGPVRETVGRRKDGGLFPLGVSVNEMALKGQRYFTGILRDITLRRQIEAALQGKNLQLESAWAVAVKTSHAKSDFLANMSHELRTPLNSVIGFSEVLQDQMFGPINEKQQEYVRNILISGRHLLSFINDILDLLESAYTKGFEGTGLGLALTRQLVKLRGGSIRVESVYGQGSSFSFTVPLTQAKYAAGVPTDA